MIVLDANILVSAVLGQQTRRVLARAVDGGVALSVPEPQLVEAARVLIDKIGLSAEETAEALDAVTNSVRPLALEFYTGRESAARARLHLRGQPDWPVLAAALAADGGVWSHDRDFFGVGVPLWSTRNIQFAV